MQVCLLNYKKGGIPFYNQFYLAPIMDTWGAAQFYVGLQMDVTDSVGRMPAMLAQAASNDSTGMHEPHSFEQLYIIKHVDSDIVICLKTLNQQAF